MLVGLVDGEQPQALVVEPRRLLPQLGADGAAGRDLEHAHGAVGEVAREAPTTGPSSPIRSATVP